MVYCMLSVLSGKLYSMLKQQCRFISQRVPSCKTRTPSPLYCHSLSPSCAGGADSEECWSLRFMWRREGEGEVYAYLPNEQANCELHNVTLRHYRSPASVRPLMSIVTMTTAILWDGGSGGTGRLVILIDIGLTLLAFLYCTKISMGLSQYYSPLPLFLAAQSSSRSLVVGWSVRRSIGRSMMFLKNDFKSIKR